MNNGGLITLTPHGHLVDPTRLQAENGAADGLRPMENVAPRSRRY